MIHLLTTNHNFYIIHKYKCTTEHNTNRVMSLVLDSHSGLELNQCGGAEQYQDFEHLKTTPAHHIQTSMNEDILN